MKVLDLQTTTTENPFMPPALRLSEQLRRAIDASDLTRYRIAKETGLSQSLLSRFMSGERGLSLDAVDKLGALLGLRLLPAHGSTDRSKR